MGIIHIAPPPYCYLILLISRRGETQRVGKKSSETGEERCRAELWNVEKDVAQPPLLFLLCQLDTWAGQRIKTQKTPTQMHRSNTQATAAKCPVPTVSLTQSLPMVWQYGWQIGGIDGDRSFDAKYPQLMRCLGNCPNRPLTSVHILLSEKTLALQISFSTTAVQLPVMISPFSLFCNVHSLCTELVRRDVIS